MMHLSQLRRSATAACYATAFLLTACVVPEAQVKSTPLPVRLLSALEFTHFTKTGLVTRSEVLGLLGEKVYLGSTDEKAYEFLALPTQPGTGPNPAAPPALPTEGKRIRVETVEQYVAALKQGASPSTTFDMAMEGWFVPPAACLNFLNRAEESRQSYLPNRLLEELPNSILGYNDSAQERDLGDAAARGVRLSDYGRSGRLRKLSSTNGALKFEFGVRDYHLRELARGDFSGDGNEDSLVVVNWRYREGTGLGCKVILVQRTQGQALTVQPFPLF